MKVKRTRLAAALERGDTAKVVCCTTGVTDQDRNIAYALFAEKSLARLKSGHANQLILTTNPVVRWVLTSNRKGDLCVSFAHERVLAVKLVQGKKYYIAGEVRNDIVYCGSEGPLPELRSQAAAAVRAAYSEYTSGPLATHPEHFAALKAAANASRPA